MLISRGLLSVEPSASVKVSMKWKIIQSEIQAFSLSNASPNLDLNLHPQFCSLLIWDWACNLASQPLWFPWDGFHINILLNISVGSKSGFPIDTEDSIFYQSLLDWVTFHLLMFPYQKHWQNLQMKTKNTWSSGRFRGSVENFFLFPRPGQIWEQS